MATRTSVGAGGDWSAAGTWDTGVPLDGDTAIIAAGTTVDFDVDQSAFVTGIIMRIDGILTVKAGADRYMKLGGNVTFGSSGTREWRIGSAETEFPVANKFTLDLNGAKEVTITNGKCLWYCAEPVHRYVKIAGATEAAGQTVLSVDMDVTGESDFWKDGANVKIDRVRYGAPNSEARVIAVGGIAAGTITITAGLTQDKEVGSYIHLVTRNIRVLGVTGTESRCFNGGVASYIRAEFVPAATGYVWYSGSYNVMGGIVANGYGALYGGSLNTFVGTSAGQPAFVAASGIIASEGIVSGGVAVNNSGWSGRGVTIFGTAAGCTTVFNGGVFNVLRGTVTGGATLVWNGVVHVCDGAIIENMQYGSDNGWITGSGQWRSGTAIRSGNAVLNGASFGVGVPLGASSEKRFHSYNHNGNPGDHRSYWQGGTCGTDLAAPLAGFPTTTIKATCTNVNYWTVFEEMVVCRNGMPVVLTGAIKAGATGMSGPALIEIVDPANDPLYDPTATALASYTCPDDTDQHAVSLTATPAAAGEMAYAIVRFRVRHSGGNAWGAWRVSGGAGPVIGSRIIRGLGAA